MSNDKWNMKMRSIHTLEGHSVVKSKEMVRFAAILMELKDFILHEVSQERKENTGYLHLHVACRITVRGYAIFECLSHL